MLQSGAYTIAASWAYEHGNTGRLSPDVAPLIWYLILDPTKATRNDAAQIFFGEERGRPRFTIDRRGFANDPFSNGSERVGISTFTDADDSPYAKTDLKAAMNLATESLNDQPEETHTNEAHTETTSKFPTRIPPPNKAACSLAYTKPTIHTRIATEITQQQLQVAINAVDTSGKGKRKLPQVLADAINEDMIHAAPPKAKKTKVETPATGSEAEEAEYSDHNVYEDHTYSDEDGEDI